MIWKLKYEFNEDRPETRHSAEYPERLVKIICGVRGRLVVAACFSLNLFDEERATDSQSSSSRRHHHRPNGVGRRAKGTAAALVLAHPSTTVSSSEQTRKTSVSKPVAHYDDDRSEWRALQIMPDADAQGCNQRSVSRRPNDDTSSRGRRLNVLTISGHETQRRDTRGSWLAARVHACHENNAIDDHVMYRCTLASFVDWPLKRRKTSAGPAKQRPIRRNDDNDEDWDETGRDRANERGTRRSETTTQDTHTHTQTSCRVRPGGGGGTCESTTRARVVWSSHCTELTQTERLRRASCSRPSDRGGLHSKRR